MPLILVAGTLDTKAEELAFVAGLLRVGGAEVALADVGLRPPPKAGPSPDFDAARIAAHHPRGMDALALMDRGAAVAAMGAAFAAFLPGVAGLAGVIGLGGGGGTSIVTAGMRALPYGLPKIIVTTMASGDTAPYVGISDLILMPAVTDLAGLNPISRTVLHNAAQAMLGMTRLPAPRSAARPALGLTMFGVTTPCVTAVAAALRDSYDCLVFHATGTGGRTMEKLLDDGMLEGVIDVTTTEVADHLFGGVLPCDDDRFGAVARTRVPWVGSLGALDMVNFGSPQTVPASLAHRRFYHHNPQVTLMRTTAEENATMGRWIASRLNRCEGPVGLLVPEGGLSALDAPGAPFHDAAADAALFDAIEATLVQTPDRRMIRLPHHINDAAFAADIVATFHSLRGADARHSPR